jgi:hypothetical protein
MPAPYIYIYIYFMAGYIIYIVPQYLGPSSLRTNV